MLDKSDPLSAAAHVVRGYHEVFPLTGSEIALLFDLACMRLCTTVAMSAHQRRLEPDNEYLSISEKPAWEMLALLAGIHPELAHFTFRHACGLTPGPGSTAGGEFLRSVEEPPDKTPLGEEFGYEKFKEHYGENAIPLLSIDENRKLRMFTTNDPPKPQPGHLLISLVRETDAQGALDGEPA